MDTFQIPKTVLSTIIVSITLLKNIRHAQKMMVFNNFTTQTIFGAITPTQLTVEIDQSAMKMMKTVMKPQLLLQTLPHQQKPHLSALSHLDILPILTIV